MFVCFGLVLLVWMMTFPCQIDAVPLPCQDVIATHEKYVENLQTKHGYLTMTPLDTRINPYFNNIALWGIVDNPEYSDSIKKWAIWYTQHINNPDKLGVQGTIYDYTVVAGGEVKPTEDYDSSDSYAATFLTLLRLYFDTNQDKDLMLKLEPSLELIAGAIYATMDLKDGLTYAKDNYKIKYLMDNLEVWQGLKDWSYLLEHVFNRAEDSRKVSQDADLIYKSLQSFWNGNTFAYAKDTAGKLFKSDTSVFYPDMTAQLMAIALDFTTPEQTAIIWTDFNQKFPKWILLQHPSSFSWTLMVYAGAKAGDWERVITYLNAVELTYGSMSYPWPWYSSEAGWYLLTLKQLPSEYLELN